jgi:flagellar basal-body rod modification protein FlgD
MSSVNATSSVLDQYQIQPRESTGDELGKNEFLELLVTQLNNQDPLSPQENGEFIAQLAQFSTVEGIETLNSSMNSLVGGFQSSQALQASSLVGRSVIVPTTVAQVDTQSTFKGSMNLPYYSPNAYVNVYDSAGAVVNRVNLGAQQAGSVSFMWDGTDSSGNKLAPGTYRFEAEAYIEGEPRALNTFLPANVDSVTLGQNGGEMQLNLAGIGLVPLSKVQVIGQ